MKPQAPTTSSPRNRPVVYKRRRKTELNPDSLRFVVPRESAEPTPDLTIENEKEHEAAGVLEHGEVFPPKSAEPASRDLGGVPESLQTYLRQIGRIALLGKEGEQAVAKKLDEAEHQAVLCVLRCGPAAGKMMELAKELSSGGLRVDQSCAIKPEEAGAHQKRIRRLSTELEQISADVAVA
ncbi:MAG: RNA polymerase sigma factor RpoD/SigA, partial [Verrucomicrobia bacterium]|nr:RNA polymerase sigma factor RpoD/SigA [Verrucomicrobiota bacterium]